MYELYIANKNYSSWSLRSWLLLRHLAIPFVEQLLRFGDFPAWEAYRRIAPHGKVPCLIHGDALVWDSLSIAEYLSERHPGVWPEDRVARSWARSASAEMHSGFQELRNRCSMNCGVRVRLHEIPAALEQDIARIEVLWEEGLARFGGPFLAGPAFTAVDAFFAPVAFRVRTYGLTLATAPAGYGIRLLTLPAMQEWYAGALQETFRDEPHEHTLHQAGTVFEDLRR